MASNYDFGTKKYCVDIVMCIDATGSMGSLLDTVKANAFSASAKEKIEAAGGKAEVI